MIQLINGHALIDDLLGNHICKRVRSRTSIAFANESSGLLYLKWVNHLSQNLQRKGTQIRKHPNTCGVSLKEFKNISSSVYASPTKSGQQAITISGSYFLIAV